jgi:glucose 1-dehydrogenase
MQKLKGQSALVTGASSGIGKAIAIELAREGAQVIVNYHGSEEKAKGTIKTIESAGGRAIAVKADVSKEEEVQQMFREMLAAFGTIDILINNAGLQQDAAFIEMSLADWQKVIDVNLTGQFLCAREAAREFVRRGVVKDRSVAAGKIICISSVHEVIPWAGHVNYAASKGGLMLFMKSIAQELAPYKIRVNGIAPGAIKTPINTEAWETKEAREKLLKLIPYGRVGETLDVAKAAVWLASDDSDYVHGASLLIDGGMALYPGFADNG